MKDYICIILNVQTLLTGSAMYIQIFLIDKLMPFVAVVICLFKCLLKYAKILRTIKETLLKRNILFILSLPRDTMVYSTKIIFTRADIAV